MAISVQQLLDEEILKAQQPMQAPVVTPEQNFAEQGDDTNLQATGRSTNQLLDQRMQERQNASQNAPNQATQEVIYDNKPDGWDDQQYEAVRSLGYTDEQIAQAFSNPDPDELMNGIFSSIYKKNVKEPQAPDERTMKRQRNIAGIGDVLSLLSQSIGSAMGARTRERGWDETASARLDSKHKELYDKYINDSDKYNRELVNAQIQDYLTGKQDWQQTKAGIQSAIQSINKQRIEAAEKAQKDTIEREKLDISRQNAESMAKKREHDMKIAEQNARSMSAYRQSLINKNSTSKTSSLSGKKADTSFYLTSETGDPNAKVDQFGRPIVEYNLSKDEIFSLAQEAKKNKEFLERNGLILEKPASDPETGEVLTGVLAKGSWKYAPDDEIALAYVQELYNSQYQAAKAGKAEFPQVAIPKPNWNESQDIWQDPLDTPSYEQQKEEQDEFETYLLN